MCRTRNPALAAVFLPIAGAIAVGMSADPLKFALPVALAASIGFMLPVATPPNAIVFANQAVTRSDMLRAGAPLDVIGIAVALAVGLIHAPIVWRCASVAQSKAILIGNLRMENLLIAAIHIGPVYVAILSKAKFRTVGNWNGFLGIHN